MGIRCRDSGTCDTNVLSLNLFFFVVKWITMNKILPMFSPSISTTALLLFLFNLFS